jgi:hypothetical protein
MISAMCRRSRPSHYDLILRSEGIFHHNIDIGKGTTKALYQWQKLCWPMKRAAILKLADPDGVGRKKFVALLCHRRRCQRFLDVENGKPAAEHGGPLRNEGFFVRVRHDGILQIDSYGFSLAPWTFPPSRNKISFMKAGSLVALKRVRQA